MFYTQPHSLHMSTHTPRIHTLAHTNIVMHIHIHTHTHTHTQTHTHVHTHVQKKHILSYILTQRKTM